MNADIARNNVKNYLKSNNDKLIEEYLKVSLLEINDASIKGEDSKSFMLNSITEKLHEEIQKKFEELGFQTKYNPSECVDYGAVASITVSWYAALG